MGVDVYWISGDGSRLDALPDPDDRLARAMSTVVPDTFPLIASVDLYARSTVTPSKEFTAEVRRLRDAQGDLDVALHLGRLLGIVGSADAVVGSYFVFVGD